MDKILETVKDIIKNPAKYRKAAVAPVATLVAVLSIVFGADAKLVVEVAAIATELGVFGIPNAKPVADTPEVPPAA